ncbi:Transglutaminase-like superfamily protein [compost metagenome]
MRRLVLMLAAVLLLVTSTHVVPAQASGQADWLDTSSVNRGVISIAYNVQANVKTKLMIVKGNDKYTYNLPAERKGESLPLQLGNGDYTVTLLEHTTGNKYKVVKEQRIQLSMKDPNQVYLNSIQNISWTSTSNAVIKAKELTKNKKTTEEKVKAVYDYIISNVKYDTQLAADLPLDYLPNIDRTFKTNKDVCYGYASLFAAMLRSLDIPTKLVMGDTSLVDVYHAWNEVYLDGEWVTIDTTVDAALKQAKGKIQFIKNASDYSMSRQY